MAGALDHRFQRQLAALDQLQQRQQAVLQLALFGAAWWYLARLLVGPIAALTLAENSFSALDSPLAVVDRECLTDRKCLVGDPDVFLSVVAQHDLIHRHR